MILACSCHQAPATSTSGGVLSRPRLDFSQGPWPITEDILLHSLECIVGRETTSMNGSPPCDSDRLLMQHFCRSPPLSYEQWRLSKLCAHHLPRCAVKYVDVRRSCLEGGKQNRRSLCGNGSRVKSLVLCQCLLLLLSISCRSL